MGNILDVKLINTPSPFLINDRAFVPLGLLYVAGMARHLGHKIAILDLLGNPNYMDALDGVRGDVFGLAATTPQYPVAVAIKNKLKAQNPGAKFVIGGSHVTLKPQVGIDDGFDVVMTGEGENAIKIILTQLSETENAIGSFKRLTQRILTQYLTLHATSSTSKATDTNSSMGTKPQP